MTKPSKLMHVLLRITVENIGIAAFGTLVPVLAHLSGFFAGKEAIFGAVAGVYWIPPLRDAAMRLVRRRPAPALGAGSLQEGGR